MRTTTAAKLVISVLALSGAALFACSTSNNGTGATAGQDAGPVGTSDAAGSTTTTHVNAAEGGTVSDPEKKVTLTIPPGALPADTDITLAVNAAESGTAASVYNFGPEGLQFTKPVSLEIKGDVTAPENKKAVLGTYADGKWQAIEGSTYASGKATGSIMHFSKYSIIIVDGEVILQPPGSCSEINSTFAACGGDPTGTWTFAEFCMPAKALGNAFEDCQGFVAELDVTMNRDITFQNGTVTNGAGTIDLESTMTIPKQCFVPDGGTPPTCAQVNDAFYKPDSGTSGSCVDEGQTACKCIGHQSDSKEQTTQTYTISGNTMTIVEDDETKTYEFCVNGDRLSAREIVDGGEPILYVLNRK